MASVEVVKKRKEIVGKVIDELGPKLIGLPKKKKLIKQFIMGSDKYNSYFEGIKPCQFNNYIKLPEYLKQDKVKYYETKKGKVEEFTEVSTDTNTSDYSKTEMTNRLEEECKKYGLPLEAVSSWKFVNHQGQNKLNIAFHPKFEVEQRSNDEFLNDLENSLKRMVLKPVDYIKPTEAEDICIINISDLHVGMNPNKDGNSLWQAKWGKSEIFLACYKIINDIKNIYHRSPFKNIVINLTGDLVDGFNKETTRGGHPLPQIMGNVEQSDVCIEFLCRLLEGLIEIGVEIQIEANSNSNHGGAFEHITLQKLQLIAIYKYGVKMNLSNKLASGYTLPGTKKQAVILHGKDQEFQSRPFPSHIEDKDDFKVEAIINAVHENRNNLKPIVFKGDSHVFNHQEKKNFYWVANAACSPDSDWCKNNFFNAGRGNCTIAIYNPTTDSLTIGNISL